MDTKAFLAASGSGVTPGPTSPRQRVRCRRPRTMIVRGLPWSPWEMRTCETRFRSSIRDGPYCGQHEGRRSPQVIQVCRCPLSLLSDVDVSHPSGPGRDRVPTGRSDGGPTSTRRVGWSSPRPHGRFGGRPSRGVKPPSRRPSRGYRTGDRWVRTGSASLQHNPWLRWP